MPPKIGRAFRFADPFGFNCSVSRIALSARLLTAADFGSAAWTANQSLLRYMPDVLVGPIEPGVSTDYQGNLILNKIDSVSGNRLLALDNELHYNITAASFASTTPMADSVQITYGGRVRITGIDLGTAKMTLSRIRKAYVEGVRGDFTGSSIEDDFINIGGDSTDQNLAFCEWTFQNIHGKGLHGTNRAHSTANTLAAGKIVTDANKRGHFYLAETATTLIEVGNDVIVTGTVYGGSSRNLNDFNCTWTVDQVVSQTEFYAVCNNLPYKAQIPASATLDNQTGKVWIMAAGTGNHADGIQHVNTSDKKSLRVRMHNVTFYTNYCGVILQNVTNRYISNFNYVFTHADITTWPTDDGTEVIRNGNQAKVDGFGYAEYYNVFGVVRPLLTIADQVSPSTLPSEAGRAITTDAFGATRNAVVWDRPEFAGGVVQGLPPVTRQNTIPNSQMVGASASPSTLPTGWALDVGGGLTTTVVGTGTIEGNPYIDVWVVGTATGTFQNIRFQPSLGAMGNVLSGQTWTGSVSCSVVGGSLANITAARPAMWERTSAGAYVTGGDGGGMATSTHTRMAYTRMLSGGATVAKVDMGIVLGYSVGAVIDVTLRISAPQLEPGSVATDYIATTTTAVTVTDYADYNALGFGYVQSNSRYSGYVEPTMANITGLTLGATSINESIAGGATIGLVDVVHNLGDHPAIFDLSITGTNVLANQWHMHGRRLVRGKTAFDYETTPGGTATVTVKAALRGSTSGRTNLCAYSQDQNAAGWGKMRGTTTGGKADPLGGTNAFEFICDGTNDPILSPPTFSGNPSGRTFTFSFWAKVGTRNGGEGSNVKVYSYGNTGIEQVSTQDKVLTTTWERFSVTRTFPAGMASTSFMFRLDPFEAFGGTNQPATGSSIFVFGFQLEESNQVTPYIPNATSSPASAGIAIEQTFSIPVVNDVANSGLTLGAPTIAANTFDGSALSSYSYASTAIGTAAANRYIVVFSALWFSQAGRAGNATATITNATNGAITANRIVAKQGAQTNGVWAEGSLYIANVPADTTATVAVGASGAATANGSGVFRLADLDTAAPFSTSSVSTDSVAGTAQLAIDIPANGAAIIGVTYTIISSNSKRFAGAVVTSASLATVLVRATVGVSAVTLEQSTNGGSSWSAIATTFDSALEANGGGSTVLVGASFAPRT